MKLICMQNLSLVPITKLKFPYNMQVHLHIGLCKRTVLLIAQPSFTGYLKLIRRGMYVQVQFECELWLKVHKTTFK